jgi:hypothetical protein
MQFIKGKNIPISIQLIKSDNTYDEDATVTYDIYESDLTTCSVSAQTATWNDTFNCYYDELDVSTDWTDQSIGNYVLKWNISDTDLFATNLIEDFSVSTDASSGSGLTAAQEAKIDAIQTDLDNPDQYKADTTTLATSAQVVTVQADLDNPDQYKADVSSLAPSGEYNTRLNTIQADLDNPDQYKADVSGLPTSAEITDDVWDEIASDHDTELSTGWLLSSIYSSSVTASTETTTTSGALVRTVNFGNGKSSLSTVGYTLLNADGGEYRARTETGVYTIGTSGGCYGANITFDDDWHGSILWDTGDDNRAWASEDFNGNAFKFITDINTDVEKILGLVHENIYMDNPGYDSDDNLTSLRVRIYSAAASVGTTDDVISTYTITSAGDGAGKFSSWQQVAS